MIVGQPGAGKSTFALWYAYMLGLPTLYFSADMASHTAITRLAALCTGDQVATVTAGIESGGIDYYESALEESEIQWCFNSGPTLDDIAVELDAYIELWNAYPELIVIDNLMNIESGDNDEHAGMRWILKELHRLARETGAAVFVLHHAREEGDATSPPARKEIQGKVAQLPEIALGVALANKTFKIAPIKNRSGFQDASGKTYARLYAEADRATFSRSLY